jgi:putative two-component system response regulator
MVAGKPKILLVDDETLYIDILVDLLKEDYSTVVAKSGAQALKRAADDPPQT